MAGPATVAQEKQGGQDPFLYVTELGDIAQASAGGERRLHVTGVIGLETAGYFRGVFDDVPEDLDAVEIGPTLRLSYELPSAGPLRDPSVTLGTGNNLWTDETAVSGDGPWFESDNFVGLATGIGQSWQAALTYTHYGSPNDASPELQELALAGRYTGLPGNPQLKAAVPVDGGDGVFLQIAAAPGVGSFGVAGHAVNVSVPLEAGLGVADYYGQEIGTSGYGTAGLVASTSLPVPERFGAWTLSGGVAATLRSDELADTDPPGAEAGSLIVIGSVGLAFVF